MRLTRYDATIGKWRSISAPASSAKRCQNAAQCKLCFEPEELAYPQEMEQFLKVRPSPLLSEHSLNAKDKRPACGRRIRRTLNVAGYAGTAH